MKKLLLSTAAVATLAAGAMPAAAQPPGSWALGVGIGYVDPKKDNLDLGGGTNVQVDAGTALTFQGEYYFAQNVAVELLLATPFSHDISVDGAGKIGETKHLPPTVSINYHFNDLGRIRPFVGLGINYTTFFDEKTVSGDTLKLDDSWGFAAAIGAEFDVSERGAIRADLRYIDIKTEATLGGTNIGKVEIDPYVFTIGYVFKF